MPTPPPPTPRFITLDAAAEILSFTTPGVRKLIARGELPGYRVGARALRVKLADVEALAKRVPVVASDDVA